MKLGYKIDECLIEYLSFFGNGFGSFSFDFSLPNITIESIELANRMAVSRGVLDELAGITDVDSYVPGELGEPLKDPFFLIYDEIGGGYLVLDRLNEIPELFWFFSGGEFLLRNHITLSSGLRWNIFFGLFEGFDENDSRIDKPELYWVKEIRFIINELKLLSDLVKLRGMFQYEILNSCNLEVENLSVPDYENKFIEFVREYGLKK